jgi:hypothetical protein
VVAVLVLVLVLVLVVMAPMAVQRHLLTNSQWKRCSGQGGEAC